MKNSLQATTNVKKSWLGNMGFNPSKSVGARLFVIFFFATMVFVLSLGLVSYNMSKNTIQNNAQLANQQAVSLTAEKLELILQRYEDSLQQSLFTSELQDMVRQASLESTDSRQQIVLKQKISAALGNWVFANPGVLAAYIIPKNDIMANVVYGTADEEFLDGVKDHEWYKTLMETKQSLWLAGESRSEDQPPSIFRLAKTLANSRGNSSYVVVVDMRTSIMTDELKKADLGGQSLLQLVTSDKQMIASSDDTGSFSSEAVFAGNESQKEQGSLKGKDVNGRPVLTVYSTIGLTHWKLVSTLPVAYLVKDVNKIISTTYITAGIVALIALFIGIWMAKTIADPLRTMQGLMQRAAKGNLNVRMKQRGKDEIGQLSSSFNDMMEQITSLVEQTHLTAIEVLDTAGELSDASRKTAISAKEIAVATEEIAIGATNLALEAERGNGFTEQFSDEMGRVIEANRAMNNAALAVGESSVRGITQLEALLETTQSTEQSTEILLGKVSSLNETASSVLQILEVLQNITKQTNILSLNATIEAARAGVAGKGFKVVADEIRGLAEQSRQSIDMVRQITDRIMSEMNDTVNVLSEVIPLYGVQMKAVKGTNEIFISVQEQMDSFIHRLESVTTSIDSLQQSQIVLVKTMGNVSVVAEQSSASSEEVASLSGEQENVSEVLVELSAKLENASVRLKERLAMFAR
ncbi:methyl-accepting chemotaxis protein [Paenibacillus segetis]|uniref:Methyl-accepting chemotaxis protein n=1 Tax=Paenibacillus segetis TaxID=1325360 RepID=A0ABQ1YJ72_9BACL|nr:methyl-accepting chemotaxis protein [Paenibacillus segetis]GGH27950.1 methyl-accepting chemotaxis protein [Paenibacillus segetis]